MSRRSDIIVTASVVSAFALMLHEEEYKANL